LRTALSEVGYEAEMAAGHSPSARVEDIRTFGKILLSLWRTLILILWELGFIF
jgi:hypothetical protein